MIVMLLIFLFITGTVAWLYIFSIYEVGYHVKPVKVETDRTYYSIEAVGLNSLGFKAIFRNAGCRFTIKSGLSRIDSIYDSESGAMFVVNNKSEQLISLSAESEYSLFPAMIELK